MQEDLQIANKCQFRVFFSYSRDKNEKYFKFLQSKLMVKQYFNSFRFFQLTNTIFSLPVYQKELSQITENVVPLQDGRYILVQYQRPDQNHHKRYVNVNSLLVDPDNPFNFNFSTHFPDIGLPNWQRSIPPLSGELPVDVISNPKCLLVNNTGDFKDFKKVQLTDENLRKQAGIIQPRHRSTEDQRYPSQQKLYGSCFFYVAEESRELYAMNTDNMTIVLIESKVECFDYSPSDWNLYIMEIGSQKMKTKAMLSVSSKGVPRVNFCREFSLWIADQKDKRKGKATTFRSVPPLINRKIKASRHVLALAGTCKATKQNLVLMCGINLISLNSKSVSKKILPDASKIVFDYNLMITRNDRSTSITNIFIVELNNVVTLILAIEAVQVHLFYHHSLRKIFGLWRENIPISPHHDGECYGACLLPGNRILFYGYYVNSIFQIDMNVKRTILDFENEG